MSARMAVTLAKASKTRPLGTLQIKCRIKPGVSKIREGIHNVTDDLVEINIAAPPRDGAANKAVIQLMSEALGIPKSELSISAGHKSKDKTIEVCPSAFGLPQSRDASEWLALIKTRLLNQANPLE